MAKPRVVRINETFQPHCGDGAKHRGVRNEEKWKRERADRLAKTRTRKSRWKPVDVEGRSEEYKGEIKNLKKMGRDCSREINFASIDFYPARAKKRARNAEEKELTTNQNDVTLNSRQIIFSICRRKYRANDRQFFLFPFILFKETDSEDILPEKELEVGRFKKVEMI